MIMSKRIILYFGLLYCIPIYSVFISFTGWVDRESHQKFQTSLAIENECFKNPIKFVVIAGERQCNVAFDESNEVIADKLHGGLIFSQGIQTMASGREKVAYILESLSDVQIINSNQPLSESKPYVGMCHSLMAFAYTYKNSYGFVDFIKGDLQNNILRVPMNLFIYLNAFYKEKGVNFYSSDFNDCIKKNILNRQKNKNILNADIKTKIPDITVRQYREKIDEISTIIKQNNESSYFFIEYKMKADQFLNEFSKNPATDLMKDVLWHVFRKRPAEYVFDQMKKWALPIQVLYEQLDLQWKLKEALLNYDVVFVHCSQKNAVVLNRFLTRSFEPWSYNGPKKSTPEAHAQAPALDCQKILDTVSVINKKIGATSLVRSCCVCKKIETIEKRMQSCGQCKSIVYCSKDCQKMDWEDHKGECNSGKSKKTELEGFTRVSHANEHGIINNL